MMDLAQHHDGVQGPIELPIPTTIQAMADDVGIVLLNGNLIGNTAGFGTPTTLTVNPQFLRPGRNCFQFSVTNAIGPTGFALAGRVLR